MLICDILAYRQTWLTKAYRLKCCDSMSLYNQFELIKFDFNFEFKACF